MDSWYKITTNEIEARLRLVVPGLKSFGLFNNQFEDLKDESLNEEYAWEFPCAFVAFGGGTWERQSDNMRVSRDYEVRLHTGSATYDESLTHLDNIPLFTNALDKWTGTYIKMDFVQDLVDDSRTNVIEHILIFRCTVVDCSLDVTFPATTQQATGLLINAQIVIRDGQAWVTTDGQSWWTVDEQIMTTIGS